MTKIYIYDDKTGRPPSGKSTGKYEKKKNYIIFYGSLYSIDGYGFVIMRLAPFRINTNIYKAVNVTFSNKSRGQFLFYIYEGDKTYISKLGSFAPQSGSQTKKIVFSTMVKQYRGRIYKFFFKGVAIDSIAIAITRSRQPASASVPLNFHINIESLELIG